MNLQALAFRHHEQNLGETLRKISLAFLLVGAFSLLLLWLQDSRKFWNVYTVNTLYWLGMAHGGILFATIIRIVYATWGRGILRLAEGTAAFIPVGFLLFLGIFLGKDYLFYWTQPDASHHHPAVWLNFPFFVIRQTLAVALLSGLSLYLLYLSVRADAGVIEPIAPTEIRPFLRRFIGGWRGKEEVLEVQKKLVNYGVVTIFAFAFAWSLIAFDMVMGMDRFWYSTMFGGYFFWGAFLSGITFTILLTLWTRHRLQLETLFHERLLHDLGKILFAFATFWANLLWAQFLTIWYGKLPEETEFIYKRMVGVWKPYGWATFVLIFLLPFVVLIPKKPKVTPAILGSMAFSVLIGLWLARFIEIVPTVWPEEGVPLGLLEIGGSLFFLGLFLLSYLAFLRRVPLIPVGDPKMEEALTQKTHH